MHVMKLATLMSVVLAAAVIAQTPDPQPPATPPPAPVVTAADAAAAVDPGEVLSLKIENSRLKSATLQAQFERIQTQLQQVMMERKAIEDDLRKAGLVINDWNTGIVTKAPPDEKK